MRAVSQAPGAGSVAPYTLTQTLPSPTASPEGASSLFFFAQFSTSFMPIPARHPPLRVPLGSAPFSRAFLQVFLHPQDMGVGVGVESGTTRGAGTGNLGDARRPHVVPTEYGHPLPCRTSPSPASPWGGPGAPGGDLGVLSAAGSCEDPTARLVAGCIAWNIVSVRWGLYFKQLAHLCGETGKSN